MSSSKKNKQLNAVVYNETSKFEVGPSSLDPYLEQLHWPDGLVSGNVMQNKRSTRTDEDCIDEVCELVAEGVSWRKAKELVGVPSVTWARWMIKMSPLEFRLTRHRSQN
jgi:hypothetical protein